MQVFSEKLSGLAATIAAAPTGPVRRVADALQESAGRHVVAVASGGSVVAAEFLARCRSTLALGPTSVRTPLEYVLGNDVREEETWFLSAGAENPDIVAACRWAIRARRTPLQLVTVRQDGAASKIVEPYPEGSTFVLPVFDPKDGFLATHSLVSMVAALLLAGNLLVEGPPIEDFADRYASSSSLALAAGGDAVAAFEPGDTLVVLHDPQVRAMATLVETSMWETGVAPVQTVDFRNFAHGRHVWAAKHPGTTFVLALVTSETRQLWSSISTLLPPSVRRATVDLGNGGRFDLATGIVRGLAMVGAFGASVGTDPGKPGAGPFARPIYEEPGLLDLVDGLTSAVRHKRRAQALHDPLDEAGRSLRSAGAQRLEILAATRFSGIVLDYDGTVVTTADRFGPPDEKLLGELTRLGDAGVRIGIATGRGGSAGEMLRNALPARLHPQVTVGYYNGGHLRTLDVDIRADPPKPHRDVAEAAERLRRAGALVVDGIFRESPVQLTIDHHQVRDLRTFARLLRDLPAVADGRLRVLSSRHSFDVIPSVSSKLAVVDALRGDDADCVLCVGDSGAPQGNDHELLSTPNAVSVDSVCGNSAGSWSLFGDDATGPVALLRLLKATRVEGRGFFIDLDTLSMDA